MTRISRIAALGGISLAALMMSATASTPINVGPFHSVSLNGGGHVVVKYGKTQKVTMLKGNTECTTIKLEGSRHDQLSIGQEGWFKCPSHYELEIEIVTPDIAGLAIHGGGDIETDGKFPQASSLSVAVHGGGTIDARSLEAASVNAAVHGGGEVLVTAKASLNAAVHGGGEIRFWGNPAVNSAVHGGGSVEKG